MILGHALLGWLSLGCTDDRPVQLYGLTAVHLDIEWGAVARMKSGSFSKTGAPALVVLGGSERSAVVSIAGGSSVDDVKTSLTIDLSRPWEGRTRYRLNAMSRDPSATLSRLSWRVFEAAGVVVPAVSSVALTLNGRYQGLYLLHATLDPDFVRSTDDRALSIYAARGTQATMADATQLDSRYSSRVGDDMSDLRELIRLVHDEENELERLEQLLDIGSVQTYMATSAFISNRDGIDNNYTLVRTTGHPQFRLWPWDLDFTFRGLHQPDGELFARNHMMASLFEDRTFRQGFDCELAALNQSLPASLLERWLDEIADEIALAFTADPVLVRGAALFDQVEATHQRNRDQEERLSAIDVSECSQEELGTLGRLEGP